MKNLNAFKALKPSRFLAQMLRIYTGETLLHAFTPVTPNTTSLMHVPSFLVLQRRYPYGLISRDQDDRDRDRAERELAMECGRLSLEEMKSSIDYLFKKKDWQRIKYKFEKWVSWTESCGNRNMPDLSLVNCYIRSRSMLGNSLKDMFVLLEQFKRDYHIIPDTLSYNIILESAHRSQGVDAAVKILNWMIGEQLPKEDSYTLVVNMLVQHKEFQSAMKYVTLASQQAYINPMEILVNAVVKHGDNEKASKKGTRIKARISKSVVSIFNSYKKYAIIFCPKWTLSDDLLQLAIQSTNLKLARFALEFITELIHQDEACTEPLHLCVSEEHIKDLFVILQKSRNNVLSNEVLLACAQVRDLSLRKHVPKAVTFLSEIHAWARFKKFNMAFELLVKYESSHGESVDTTLFCPFTQLKPLVLECRSCSKEKISEILNYLEALRKDNPEHKFLAGLNCLILVYANIKDVVGAMSTFHAISHSFGVTPDINSYNAMIYAYVLRKQRNEAKALYNDLVHAGIEPNEVTEMLMFKAIVNEGLRYAVDLLKMASSMSRPSTSPPPNVRVARKTESYSVDKGCVWTREYKTRFFRD